MVAITKCSLYYSSDAIQSVRSDPQSWRAKSLFHCRASFAFGLPALVSVCTISNWQLSCARLVANTVDIYWLINKLDSPIASSYAVVSYKLPGPRANQSSISTVLHLDNATYTRHGQRSRRRDVEGLLGSFSEPRSSQHWLSSRMVMHSIISFLGRLGLGAPESMYGCSGKQTSILPEIQLAQDLTLLP